MKLKKLRPILFSSVFLLILTMAIVQLAGSVRAAEQSGSIGVEGRISAPPPTQGATISLPRDGQAFTTLPIDVSGICPQGLLVKLFKNNVFAGSQQCTNGNFSIKIDLFTGTNELIARVYDALDQPGPDSNKVTVSFNDNKQGTGSRVSLTSNFAKRGANPGQTLTWPIILSGGTGPFAVSIDWGDGKAPDLKSVLLAGVFSIEHIYDSAGIYNIVIKVTDANGESAFLQLVGIANGALSEENGSGKKGSDGPTITRTRILWQPAAFAIPLIFMAFWLGKRHELHTLRKKIERGDRPF